MYRLDGTHNKMSGITVHLPPSQGIYSHCLASVTVHNERTAFTDGKKQKNSGRGANRCRAEPNVRPHFAVYLYFCTTCSCIISRIYCDVYISVLLLPQRTTLHGWNLFCVEK